MSTEALFRKVLQVGLVVRDSEATARALLGGLRYRAVALLYDRSGQHDGHAIPWSCRAALLPGRAGDFW